MKRLLLSLGIAALAVVTAACSGATAAPATDAPAASAPAASAPAGDAIVIVTAGQPVEIVLDNQEGAPHNIAIKDADGADVFKGEIVSNAKVTYAIPALAAGTYGFLCEVHPDMQGTITAQ
jgi:plastocyanin